MKGILSWTIVIGLLALIIGCGGGGSGGSSSGSTGVTGSTGSTSGAVHSEQVTGYQGSVSGPMLDTRSLVPGDTVQMELTARDVNQNLVILQATGWTTNAPGTVATLSSGGLLTAVGSSGGTSYTITVKYRGIAYQGSLVVVPAQDFVTGTLTNGTNAVENAGVDFYNAAGKLVGAAYSTRDGSFRASVPGTAVGFTLDMSLADPGGVYYYNEYYYGPATYLEETTCLTSIPTLSATAPTALPHAIAPYLRTLGPPPPPTGCL